MSKERGALTALDQAAVIQALKLKIRQAIADSAPDALPLDSLLPLLDPDSADSIARAADAWTQALQRCPPAKIHREIGPSGDAQ